MTTPFTDFNIDAFTQDITKLIPGALVIVATVVVFQVIKNLIYNQLRKLDSRELVDAVADRIEKLGITTALATGAYFAAVITEGADPNLIKALYILLTIVWGWQAVQLIIRFINYGVDKAAAKSDRGNLAIYKFVGSSLKVILWVIIALSVLGNLGYDVTSLIAGLGVSGIAVALAVQSLLGDFISSVSIVADKPFRVGDFIIVGEHKGTVTKVGVRSTHVRSLDGEDLIFPNSELVKSTIRNFGAVKLRRAVHIIGVTYETKRDLLKDIPVFITDIFNSVDSVEPETARVHFVNYGDYSINFELSFEIKGTEYVDFLNTQQEVLFKIMDKFDEEGIEFAYPTQLVYTQKS